MIDLTELCSFINLNDLDVHLVTEICQSWIMCTPVVKLYRIAETSAVVDCQGDDCKEIL